MRATVWFVDERGDMRRVDTRSRALVESLERRYGRRSWDGPDAVAVLYRDEETNGLIALV